MSLVVPNEHPIISSPSRIAIVGEAPGRDEETMGKPFVGVSGKLLQGILSQCQILRTACFVGNVCQVRPPNNDIKAFAWDSTEIQSGLAQLKQDITTFNPNITLLLGATALRAAGVTHSISDYRGSLFICRDNASPFFLRKCIASFHPAAVLRQFSFQPLLAFDIQRVREESLSPDLVLPARQFECELTSHQICQRLDAINDSTLVSIDIEGGIQQGISCVGISTSPTNGFIVNVPDFSIPERVALMRSLARVLSSPTIPKVLQNSLYDNFVLSWLWKMPIRNVVHDTMLSGWEIYPELPKSLGVQASIWTREPFYKFERKVDDKLTHYTYCCKDSSVTYEIAQRHQVVMQNARREHFDFNMSLLPAMLYMQLRGFRFDKEKCKVKLEELKLTQSELQARIDAECGVELNCNSPKQLNNVLYKQCSFEPQYKKEGGRKTDSLTTDQEALLVLLKKTDSPLVLNILKWKALDGQRKQLELDTDADGRMRCAYNLVGTETGRMTCYESPTGSGSNLQTITKKLRELFIADEGKMMFQCDLSGADGWTVAAHSKQLGDETMWLDYNAGIKPARVIAAMYRYGVGVSKLPQQELKQRIKELDIEEWLYFTCKRVQHGSNYGLGKITMSSVILKDSWKVDGNPIYVTSADCEKLQQLYLSRYFGVGLWQRRIEAELKRNRTLPCASGHVRRFFGRPDDHDTFKEALAHEPQANTTYATNLALYRLWNDPDNRDSTGNPIIEPIHQVHDALIGQFPSDRASWAIDKIRQYFANPLSIAGLQVTIPFEGNYGSSWGTLEHAI